MATNLVFRNTDSENRWDDIGRTVLSGDPVISTWGPAVAVTSSGNATGTETFGAPIGGGTQLTLSGIPAGGVGNDGTEYAAASDGTWEFLASSFNGTAPNPATITKGTAINYHVASNSLTTAATSGSTVVAFGKVDFPKDYNKTRGFIPVRIGPFAA